MTIIKNYLPSQYIKSNKLEINHNYLFDQFYDHEIIWKKIREVVLRGDFTLGLEVDNLEQKFAKLNGVKYAISVGSGTDALFLSLKAIGIEKGDEVITTPFTFYATVGAIITSGATPVFCDVSSDFNIDADLIESKITSKTKAILPVHWSGNPCDMDKIEKIANKYSLPIISDACHAIKAKFKGRAAGSLGTISCFSFHPLKNLNVWGDGGIITTNSEAVANSLRLLRNHGLSSRDRCEVFAYNSRLDTIQAVVANHMLEKISNITSRRVKNANYFDANLSKISDIFIPKRDPNKLQVYHIYSIICKRRDELEKFLIENNVDAKIHYPVPMHLQPAANYLGYKVGDFPIAEEICNKTLSLPVHEFITKKQMDYVIRLIEKFYS